MKGAFIAADAWEKFRNWLNSEIPPKVQEQRPAKCNGPFNKTFYLKIKHILDHKLVPADDETIADLPKAFLMSCKIDVFCNNLYKNLSM